MTAVYTIVVKDKDGEVEVYHRVYVNSTHDARLWVSKHWKYKGTKYTILDIDPVIDVDKKDKPDYPNYEDWYLD